MRYLILAYGEESKFNALTQDQLAELGRKCKAFDDELARTGRVVAGGSLSWGATTIRVKDGKPQITDGPFIDSKEVVGGFQMIEARDLNEAIQLASLHPAARMGEELGWGVEVRPMDFCQMHRAASEREIVSTRLFRVPRALMHRAWVEAEHLAKWWGPNGFTNTIQEFEPRAGGAWRFVMHGPDGKDWPNDSVFEEVSSKRIAIEHRSAPHFLLHVDFEEEMDGTRVVFRMIFDDKAACDEAKTYCVECNEQNFDRLQAELDRMR